jgi:peptidoglycan hydrolase-like protein with peptidoglycan-binding domain
MNIKSSLAIAGAVGLALGVTPLAMGQMPTRTNPATTPAAPMTGMHNVMNRNMGQHKLSRGQVMHLQRKLDQKGYHLKQDGKWGSGTRTALMKFQKKNGLRASGYPDSKTRNKLGITNSQWQQWASVNAAGMGTAFPPAGATMSPSART